MGCRCGKDGGPAGARGPGREGWCDVETGVRAPACVPCRQGLGTPARADAHLALKSMEQGTTIKDAIYSSSSSFSVEIMNSRCEEYVMIVNYLELLFLLLQLRDLPFGMKVNV